MPAPSVLRHRGIEAWLEDTQGHPIFCSEDVEINSNCISAWVNVKPRQYYTLRWRTCAGRNPRSGLCRVFVKDGFHSASDDLGSYKLASTSIMDDKRKTTQAKTTKGWLNSPYKRYGCLRICSRIQAYRNHPTKTQPDILSLGSVRLEVRRVRGEIRNDQVHWGKKDDGYGICVFDPNGIEVVDDAARGKPPYIIFEFKFREDPEITRMTQSMQEDDTKIGIVQAIRTGLLAISRAEDPRATRPIDSNASTSITSSTSTSSLPLPRVKTVRNDHLKATQKLSKSGTLALPAAEDTSSLPLVAQARSEIADLVAHSGLNVAVTTSQSEVPDHPSSPPKTTENVFHTEIIISTEPAIRTGQSASALIEGTTTANPGMQIGHSDGELQVDGRPPTNTEDTIHTKMIQITKSVMPTTEPSPASMDITTTANPGMQIGHSDGELQVDGRPPTNTEDTKSVMPTTEPSPAPMDITATANPGMQIEALDGDFDGGRMGVLSSEEIPTGFFPSRNSPDGETDSHIAMPSQSSPEMVPQINEVQQQSTEGSDLTIPASTEIVNAAPDVIMTLNLDIDGREQLEPNPVEVSLLLGKSSDIVELSPTRQGKRKMVDRGGDNSAGVPAGDGGFKKKHKTMVEEDDYSDIEFIGSWSPRKTNKKVKTTVKMENLPINLENPVSASNPLPTLTTVKSECSEIKLEDDQLDRKHSIDEMMENYDALERKKEELKQLLAVKMEAQKREIKELKRRLRG